MRFTKFLRIVFRNGALAEPFRRSHAGHSIEARRSASYASRSSRSPSSSFRSRCRLALTPCRSPPSFRSPSFPASHPSPAAGSFRARRAGVGSRHGIYHPRAAVRTPLCWNRPPEMLQPRQRECATSSPTAATICFKTNFGSIFFLLHRCCNRPPKKLQPFNSRASTSGISSFNQTPCTEKSYNRSYEKLQP